jgi:hypothetical protein
MVTQFPIRLSVYAQQFEDVAANAQVGSKVDSGGGEGGGKGGNSGGDAR